MRVHRAIRFSFPPKLDSHSPPRNIESGHRREDMSKRKDKHSDAEGKKEADIGEMVIPLRHSLCTANLRAGRESRLICLSLSLSLCVHPWVILSQNRIRRLIYARRWTEADQPLSSIGRPRGQLDPTRGCARAAHNEGDECTRARGAAMTPGIRKLAKPDLLVSLGRLSSFLIGARP